MPLSEGWRDQYERMLRSRVKLIEAAGPSSIGSNEARDRLYHFFQDAYHLKDWIINDLGWYTMNGSKRKLTQDGQDLENHITATASLARCADVCNGTKHLLLQHPRIPGKPTELVSQSVSIMLPTVEAKAYVGGAPPKEKKLQPVATAEHIWEISFDGQREDAVQVADETVAAWESWLKANSLL